MPRKTFTAGSILTATDLNTYLSNQAVNTFTNTADRTASIPSPTIGMVSWLNDVSRLDLYSTDTGSLGSPTWLPLFRPTAQITGAGAQTGWSITSFDGWFNASSFQWEMVFSRTGASITVPATGNIANQLVANVDANMRNRRMNTPCTSTATGPVMTGYVDATGNVYITATTPNVTINTGDSFSLACSGFIGGL